MRLRAITLDAAGTLFAPAEPVGTTYARVAARHGIALDAAATERAFRRAFGAAPPLAFPGVAPGERAERERAWWRAVVRGAFGAAAAGPGFGPCFAELFAHYAEAGAWRVFPDVPRALTTLRARGLRTAVVSNFDGRLAGLLDGLGLMPLVDAALHSSAVGAAKPDAAIFRAALARLDVEAAQALHAGDSLALDVAGAHAAGLRAVLVARGAVRRTPRRGAPTVTTLTQLAALVA